MFNEYALAGLAIVAAAVAFAGIVWWRRPVEGWLVSCAVIPLYLIAVVPSNLDRNDGAPISLTTLLVGASLSAWAGGLGLWAGHALLQRRSRPQRRTRRPKRRRSSLK